MDAERDNILAALHTALERGDATATQMDHFLAHHDRRGLHASGTDTFAALADAAEDACAPDSVQAAAQIASMWLAYRAGRLLDAQTLAGHFLAGPLATDPTSRMKVLNTLSAVRAVQGQMQSATDLLRQALALAVELGDQMRAVFYRVNIMSNLAFVGTPEQVQEIVAQLRAEVPSLPEGLAWMVRERLLQSELYTPGADTNQLLTEVQQLTEYAERAGNVQTFHQATLMQVRLLLRQQKIRQAEQKLNDWRKHLTEDGQPGDRMEWHLLSAEVAYARGRAEQDARMHVTFCTFKPVPATMGTGGTVPRAGRRPRNARSAADGAAVAEHSGYRLTAPVAALAGGPVSGLALPRRGAVRSLSFSCLRSWHGWANSLARPERKTYGPR